MRGSHQVELRHGKSWPMPPNNFPYLSNEQDSWLISYFDISHNCCDLLLTSIRLGLGLALANGDVVCPGHGGELLPNRHGQHVWELGRYSKDTVVICCLQSATSLSSILPNATRSDFKIIKLFPIRVFRETLGPSQSPWRAFLGNCVE